MNEIITIPLSTATPDKAIKPTTAIIDRGMPRNHSDRIPPVSASRTPVKTSKALSFVFPAYGSHLCV